MKISLDWIREFCELPEKKAQQYASDFTLAVAEVEGAIETHAHLDQVKIVEITQLRPHPEADRLRLVGFSDGKKNYEVVCGAPNVREGLKVPFAAIGTTLPGGFTLTPKKIRGVLSEGMLCSAQELGLGDESAGLWELPSEAPLGKTILSWLEKKCDLILDIDNKSLTHRPDLWGHYGMAREFSVLYETPLREKFSKEWQEKLESAWQSAEASPVVPEVMAGSAGLVYYGLSIDGVQVAASPPWLVEKLESVGLRSINNLVDISNYVMLELGMPLHIFDREKIKGNRLFIKPLEEEISFQTLDGQERLLQAGDTVICDGEKPLVLAGIMGGESSAVDENTTKIFIEVANWQASAIRQTSVRLGLRTDSSQRYEKSLDSHQCYRTLLRTYELVQKLCSKSQVVGKVEKSGVQNSEPPLVINTSVTKITQTLGKEIPAPQMIKIFQGLGFQVQEKKDFELEVTLPSWRTTKDITGEADLVEEIGRFIGYDHITPCAPKSAIRTTKLSAVKKLHRKIEDFWMHHYYHQVFTYPLVGQELYQKVAWPASDFLTLKNPMSQECDRMRISLLPSLIEALANNSKHLDHAQLFEIGRVYSPDKKSFLQEKNMMVAGIFSRTEKVFAQALNHGEQFLKHLKINFNLLREDRFPNPLLADWSGVHTYEKYHVQVMGKIKGAIFSLHPHLLKKLKIKGNVAFFCLDLSSIEALKKEKGFTYTPINKHPQAFFDFTLEVKKNVYVEDILKCAQQFKIDELESLKVVDIYSNESEYQMITLRSIFSSQQKTIKEKELQVLQDNLISGFRAQGYPLKGDEKN